MNKNNFLYKAILLAISYWLVDSTFHKYLYGENEFELLPTDIDELWMRILIVIILILFGLYADYHTKCIRKKEAEKLAVFNATVRSTQHIVFNLINQMQYFKLVADKTNVFDQKVNKLYEETMKEAKELVDNLSAVDELTEESINRSTYPEEK